MIRRIVGFHQDEEGDWVAHLSCLHRQHVRHRPPFQDRPWVVEEETRNARVGSPIDCPLCDRAALPDGLVMLRRAGPWDEDGVPAGLRRAHRTAEGTWGVLEVLDGAVGFRMETEPPVVRTLERGARQAIPPAVPHELRISGAARVCLEHWGDGTRAVDQGRP